MTHTTADLTNAALETGFYCIKHNLNNLKMYLDCNFYLSNIKLI